MPFHRFLSYPSKLERNANFKLLRVEVMHGSTITFLIALFLCFTAIGQESLSGTIYDGHTQQPLENATVRMGNRNMRTDATGSFTIPVKKDKNLEVSASGFHDCDRKPYDIVHFKNMAIYLVPKPKIQGLKVSAEAVGVYEPNFEYIYDFEFIDNLLVIGSYLNRNISNSDNNLSLENCALTLFDRGEMTHRILTPDFPQRLRRSAFNELFIEGLDYALIVSEEGGKLSYKEFDLKEFKTNVVPYTVAFSKSAFSVKIVREIPQVVHYCYHADIKSHEVIRTARNRSYFSKTFLDYTMLDQNQRSRAISLSEAQGFDKKLYAGYIRALNREPNFRSQQPYITGVDRDLRPPYTPVYKKEDSILILDAMNQWIYHHNQDGEVLDSVYFQIDLPGFELWHIEQDRVSEKLYTFHKKQGVYFIRELDPYTGALSIPMKVAYPFPEKLKVYNGNVFYLRHDADEHFKHLYKEYLDF